MGKPSVLPDAGRRAVLDELDATLGHALGRGARDAEARRRLAAILHPDLALERDDGWRLEPRGDEARMDRVGLGRAEADEMGAGIARHRRAQLRRVGGVAGGREELQVAAREHGGAVRRAGGDQRPAGLGAMDLVRDRGERESHAREVAARGVDVGQEMRHVVEHQPARGRHLARGGVARGQDRSAHVSSCLLWWRCMRRAPGMAAKARAVAWSVSAWNLIVQTMLRARPASRQRSTRASRRAG